MYFKLTSSLPIQLTKGVFKYDQLVGYYLVWLLLALSRYNILNPDLPFGSWFSPDGLQFFHDVIIMLNEHLWADFVLLLTFDFICEKLWWSLKKKRKTCLWSVIQMEKGLEWQFVTSFNLFVNFCLLCYAQSWLGNLLMWTEMHLLSHCFPWVNMCIPDHP